MNHAQRRPLRAILLLSVLLVGCVSAPAAQTPGSALPNASNPVAVSSDPASSAASAAPAASAAASAAPAASEHAGHEQPAASVSFQYLQSIAPRLAELQPAATNPNCAIAPINLTRHGGGSFKEPDVIRSENGVLSTTLTIAFNVFKIAGCPVKLRTYNGSLVGPTLRVKPGDTIRIRLENNLPANPLAPGHSLDTPHDFNTTNLHTHGLHVSPVGNSDNVLLEIEPQTDFEFEIKIPGDHPAGTYWYHPHAHGSTAPQVASGMEGALIIEGDYNGVSQITSAQERVFVFQQIPYSTTGEIELYDQGFVVNNNYGISFGPCTWEGLQREHTVNGQLFPTLTMDQGEVQRWRFIHAGVRETLSLELHGPYTGSGLPSITDTLALPTISLNEIGVDGIALGKLDAWQTDEINPGYRSDVLVQPTRPGTYFLVDGDSDTDALTCPSNPEQPSYLAKLVVRNSSKNMQLPRSEQLARYAPLKSLITIDASQRPGSENFLQPANGVTIDGFQEMSFTVAVHQSQNATFLASDRPFSFDHVRTLTLGNTEQWILETKPDSLYYAHPFHIHVNPFQTWREDPAGNPELIWRDTLMVPKTQKQYVYTQYTDYIGQYVYHCHILDHEDQGMMELVEIVNLPQ